MATLTLSYLIVNFLSFILASGIGTFIAQKLFEQRLKKEMYRFTKIYSDKIDIIKEFYKKLIKAEKALILLMERREPNDHNEREEFKKQTYTVIDDFFDYFDENEVVFETSIIDLINQLRHKFKEARTTHSFATMMESDRGSKEWAYALDKKNKANEQYVVKEIPELKIVLKKEFQKRYQLLQK